MTTTRSNDPNFAYVDADGGAHLPIRNEQEIREAISAFSGTDFDSSWAKEEARQKILAAASGHGIEVGEDSDLVESAKVRETGTIGGPSGANRG